MRVIQVLFQAFKCGENSVHQIRDLVSPWSRTSQIVTTTTPKKIRAEKQFCEITCEFCSLKISVWKCASVWLFRVYGRTMHAVPIWASRVRARCKNQVQYLPSSLFCVKKRTSRTLVYRTPKWVLRIRTVQNYILKTVDYLLHISVRGWGWKSKLEGSKNLWASEMKVTTSFERSPCRIKVCLPATLFRLFLWNIPVKQAWKCTFADRVSFRVSSSLARVLPQQWRGNCEKMFHSPGWLPSNEGTEPSFLPTCVKQDFGGLLWILGGGAFTAIAPFFVWFCPKSIFLGLATFQFHWNASLPFSWSCTSCRSVFSNRHALFNPGRTAALVSIGWILSAHTPGIYVLVDTCFSGVLEVSEVTCFHRSRTPCQRQQICLRFK